MEANTTEKREEICFGFVPFMTDSNGNRRYLLIQGVKRRRWQFPKGHREKFDQNDLACAKREFTEETGIESSHWKKIFEDKKMTIEYNRKTRGKKQVTFWPLELTHEVEPTIQESEISAAKWLDSSEVHQTLTQVYKPVFMDCEEYLTTSAGN
mmetsp:Transcript_64542/g.74127  ORF Transcript_64542/g.74127 Transcript_64542/m.74127 type:complete len:153 (-) Transcript_64542:1008-1466(-)